MIQIDEVTMISLIINFFDRYDFNVKNKAPRGATPKTMQLTKEPLIYFNAININSQSIAVDRLTMNNTLQFLLIFEYNADV